MQLLTIVYYYRYGMLIICYIHFQITSLIYILMVGFTMHFRSNFWTIIIVGTCYNCWWTNSSRQVFFIYFEKNFNVPILETNFHVKPLPKARIPIIKLTLTPTPALPYGIACDIGFGGQLALENTRLLLGYASVDPPRLRTLVLFIKVWSKRRKINSAYRGTLSSYGFTLLVIFFLAHVKQPPVLPNLQRIPPLRPVTPVSLI